MSRYVVKKNKENLYVKHWGSTPTGLHFRYCERKNKSIYTDDIGEAKVYISIGGAKSSIRKYVNLFHHTIKELKLSV